ncbi:OPT oligopeptide transporter protein-domain-containing protein [Diplogelasinospora grovesii]|uniref:OPT oligopeptide transporter protein-domain-containing protein n=1 Tax=Diplogelasinospora grovesii TaxID=303347 RepID=A0AAN6S2Z1_9PEZI|nr:OPT oligopeptide transporter protein-domain-containing protein [Diplogelasinospora grovesii]
MLSHAVTASGRRRVVPITTSQTTLQHQRRDTAYYQSHLTSALRTVPVSEQQTGITTHASSCPYHLRSDAPTPHDNALSPVNRSLISRGLRGPSPDLYNKTLLNTSPFHAAVAPKKEEYKKGIHPTFPVWETLVLYSILECLPHWKDGFDSSLSFFFSGAGHTREVGCCYSFASVLSSCVALCVRRELCGCSGVMLLWQCVYCGRVVVTLPSRFELCWLTAWLDSEAFEDKTEPNLPNTVFTKHLRTALVRLWLTRGWAPHTPLLNHINPHLCSALVRLPVANFIGAGFGGMGFLNLSFDWSSINSTGASLFLTPWWTQVIQFLAYAFSCWVLLPAAKWGNLGSWKHHLMSNRFFMDILLWSMFFDYASYTSAVVWMALFGYSQLKDSFKNFWERRKSGSTKISEQYDDQLNVLHRAYPEVPLWWFIALFLCSFVILATVTAHGDLFIPVWTYFVAIATGAIIVVPLGWLYALSNFQLPIGTTNELLYGLMVNAVDGFKNPAGASTYGSIAGDAWYRAQYILQDMKIGHYMHVPPRAASFSQIFGSFIGVPINYAVIRWVVDSKRDYLTGAVDDPTHQWTGQWLASSLTLGVQYALLGPKRLFQIPMFAPLPYGFLMGTAAPLVMSALNRLFPRMKFRLWNTTIFFSSMSTFYGNISTGYTSSFLSGFVVMFWAYRWNYILAAAFDAGFNVPGKVITMPNWWGNDVDSSERCFALSDD